MPRCLTTRMTDDELSRVKASYKDRPLAILHIFLPSFQYKNFQYVVINRNKSSICSYNYVLHIIFEQDPQFVGMRFYTTDHSEVDLESEIPCGTEIQILELF